MRVQLHLHPDSICEAVRSIEVEAREHEGRLLLRYCVAGVVAGLALPPRTGPRRAHNLWQHSCFEAFLRESGDIGYCELNLAPSTQWAAYRFGGYRAGIEDADIPAPDITTTATADCFELRASLVMPVAVPLRLALSAVIEETNGRKSYWALTHPPGKADFHHPDSFILELPPS